MPAALLQLQTADAECCWNKTCGMPRTAESPARRMIGRARWEEPVDPMEGVIVHETIARRDGWASLLAMDQYANHDRGIEHNPADAGKINRLVAFLNPIYKPQAGSDQIGDP